MGVFSRFYKNLGLIYLKLIKHILQYISGILNLGLKFDRKVDTPDNVVGYIDSQFVELKIDWKSTKSYIFILV